jgi:hypothetical protein
LCGAASGGPSFREFIYQTHGTKEDIIKLAPQAGYGKQREEVHREDHFDPTEWVGARSLMRGIRKS